MHTEQSITYLLTQFILIIIESILFQIAHLSPLILPNACEQAKFLRYDVYLNFRHASIFEQIFMIFCLIFDVVKEKFTYFIDQFFRFVSKRKEQKKEIQEEHYIFDLLFYPYYITTKLIQSQLRKQSKLSSKFLCSCMDHLIYYSNHTVFYNDILISVKS